MKEKREEIMEKVRKKLYFCGVYYWIRQKKQNLLKWK